MMPLDYLKLRNKYPDARDAELFFLWELEQGYLSLDDDGRFWRHFCYFGKSGRWLDKPVRADVPNDQGYRRLRKNQASMPILEAQAHRIVWMATNGNIPEGLHIHHKNARRSDNRLCNIEPVTPAQNSRNTAILGRARGLKGEANKNSKLTTQQVIKIRKMKLEDKLSYSKIAAMFNITKRNVICIVKRITWKHVK